MQTRPIFFFVIPAQAGIQNSRSSDAAQRKPGISVHVPDSIAFHPGYTELPSPYTTTIPPFEKGGLGGIPTTSALATAHKSPPAPLLQSGENTLAHGLT